MFEARESRGPHAEVLRLLKSTQGQATAVEVYTVREVANILKVSTKTVRDWIRKGRLKAVRIGRILRVPEDELRRLLFESEQPSGPSNNVPSNRDDRTFA